MENTVLARAAIAAEIGVCVSTIDTWQRRHRWVRPAGKRRGRGIVADAEVRARPRRVSRGGKGRFYGPEVVAAVRRLVEETVLTRGAIAARTGVSLETVSVWMVRDGWSRPPGTTLRPPPDGAATASAPRPWKRGGATQAPSGRAGGPWAASSASPPRHAERGFVPLPNRRSRCGKGRPYGRETVERVQALVEGTGLSQAAIASRAGIAPATVATWMRERGWRRPLDAARCTRFVAVDRAGLSARVAAGFGRLAAVAEREAARLAPEAACLARLAEAARRLGRHYDRAGLARLPGHVRPGEPWEPVRLSAVPPAGRQRRPRGEADLAVARDAWERTLARRDVIARGFGIHPPTLTGWAQQSGWIRPPGAPSPFGGPARNPGWTERRDGKRAALHRLGEAERLLSALEAGGAEAALPDPGRIEAAFGLMGGAVASLRRLPSPHRDPRPR